MRSQPTFLLLAALVSAGSLGVPGAAEAAVDPFYQTLLRDGQQAYERKDFAAAARELRLACFGMLEEPPTLAACLTRLALAQETAGDLEGFRETFRRLTEVEERFKGYSQGEIAPELRATLETRLAARIPAATLAGLPAFRSAIQAAAQAKKGAGVPTAPANPPKPTPAPLAPAVKAPEKEKPQVAVKPAADSGERKGAAVPSHVVPPAVPPSAVAAAAPKPLTDAERQKLEQARKLLGDRRTAKELRQAFDLSSSVADAHPESKEAQLLAAEGAYRISRWSDAAAYFKRGGDPGDDEPERLFYLAVALYESGDAPAAAAALRRSLPNLKRTPYVDGYARKILGQ
jgi:hypothetical protein